ncbi:hypothetical protein [Streptomyces sp. NBC_01190]|uniref:hypothetical protein n=1 Tax=Streptomyces sp. NBC_01190 TaxID=2903767 RepID=UPI00386BE01E|nr:DUF3827 domain-containing protein [Streptomyces sp. NBC_01190]
MDRSPQGRPFEEWRGIHDWLDAIRLRPGMWVPDGSLRELSALLFGYYVALQIHQVAEPFEFRPAAGGFADWLRRSRGWSTALGWDGAITANSFGEPPLEVFFRLLDEYRASSRSAVAVRGRD